MAPLCPKVLFLDDDPLVLEGLRRSLRHLREQWNLSFHDEPETALTMMQNEPADIVISDLSMGHLNGLDIIRDMRITAAEATYMVLTGAGDYETALKAINSGTIFKFFTKPCPTENLIESIEQALKLKEKKKLENAQKQTNSLDEALELLAPSFLILDQQAKLIYANLSAMSLLNLKDGLTLDAGDICRATNAQQTKLLHDALHATLQENETPQTVYLSLQRPSGKRDLSIALSRSRRKDDQGLCFMIVSDPESQQTPDHSSLSSLFQLSTAEAKIAQAIASGHALEDAAFESGIALSSARTYLKRVYSKLGVNRQADLAKLILSSPAALMKR